MLKFANCTTSMRYGERVVRVAQGDPWHADDPFVRAHPELFDDQPERVFGTVEREAPVERATARPGEKRVTRG